MSWRKTLGHLNRGGAWATRPGAREVDITPHGRPTVGPTTPSGASTSYPEAASGSTPVEHPHPATEDERAFAPHCDQRILHAPGECWACDLYPDWQALRVKWGIDFSGHSTPGNLPCPADYHRPRGSSSDHRQWGPNQAQGEKS